VAELTDHCPRERQRAQERRRPQSEWSHFPQVGSLRWHVQQAGQGPVLLLLHGTGSAGHSWRGLMPLLGAGYTVIAPDLPGHGRTGDPGAGGLSLTGMATHLRALLDLLELEPAAVIGHSAGAALACRMSLDGQLGARHIVSLNGALLPPLGMPLHVFAPLARLLAATPLVPEMFAYRARDPAAVQRLIAGTGSRLDAAGLAFYGQLMRDPRHVSAALRMMASWDLAGLARDLPGLDVRLDLLVADGDRTISPSEALRVQTMLPRARISRVLALGHLAHEEDPDACMRLLSSILAAPPAAQPPNPGRARL
jgi:magnesium chelatase accessory protein